VYYRDINDQRNQQTVITHLRVLYTDGTSTDGTDQGTTQLTPTATDAGTNGNSGSANSQAGTTSDGQTVGLNGNEDLNVVNSGDDAPVVNNEGTDTNTERIDDNETPLAAGNSQATPSSIAPIAAIIGMLIVAALVSLYVIKRKKHEQIDPQSASDVQDK
jgi:cobalamin biosynthesis Mg chelatase CobN